MKAVIAMSGGVDSSVAAALMLERGCTCIGVTLKLYGEGSRCCSLKDVNDAKDTAHRLGIPHYTLNFTEAFENEVIRRFIGVYESGGTPNPCIDCNRYIKWKALLLRSRQLDFDSIATGHYARVEKDGNGRALLRRSKDPKKDQTYVLYALTQEELAHTVFPLGDMTKEEARKIALEKNFVNAKKEDSQDICFVSGGGYGTFIETYTGKKYPRGDIVDAGGKVLGSHRGIVRYTIGQRRRLGVALNYPAYVCAKSAERNTVTLGPESSLYSKAFTASDINLIAVNRIERPMRVTVKTRYLSKEAGAVAEQTGDNSLRVELDEPERALTPGQAAVLYDGEYVIGGGTIDPA
ncbi:MAG: tRNA 2-thiouridine(34) synthase MnmA [Treponema sp.]|nr:tRNA 2-thiouridine(34) synthase MnmA [Treponema sp.]